MKIIETAGLFILLILFILILTDNESIPEKSEKKPLVKIFRWEMKPAAVHAQQC